jgi:hypothetical protein
MKLNRFLKANNTRASLLSTYDFSTLYTTLPQYDRKIRMRSLLEQLFNANKAANNKCFLLPSDVNPWRSKPSTSTKQKFWSHADISDTLDYLIDNTFVSIGDRIFRQIIGIPMGTNCAVYLANFFLFTYELDFIRTLIAENKFDVLKAFANTFRYIDDVLPLNNPFFETYLPSIYPHSLKVNLEQTGNTVHFLDLIIKCKNSKKFPFTTDLFDKRTLPKFANLPMTRYPHRSSFVPAHFGLNIVTSQGFRLLRRCLRKKDFIFHFAKIITELYSKGFSKKLLFKTAGKFICRNLHLLFKAPSVGHLKRLLTRRVNLMLLP